MNSSTSDISTTTFADPWSTYGYADWQNSAVEIRKAWMRMMGLDEQEIAEHCRNAPPTDVDDELAEYNAMFSIEERNRRMK